MSLSYIYCQFIICLVSMFVGGFMGGLISTLIILKELKEANESDGRAR